MTVDKKLQKMETTQSQLILILVREQGNNKEDERTREQ